MTTTTHKKARFEELPIGREFVIFPEDFTSGALPHYRKVSDHTYRKQVGNELTEGEIRAEPDLEVREVVEDLRTLLGCLPRWRMVAFAERCARRVLPLVQHDWPDVPEDDLQTVWEAAARLKTFIPHQETLVELDGRVRAISERAVGLGHTIAGSATDAVSHALTCLAAILEPSDQSRPFVLDTAALMLMSTRAALGDRYDPELRHDLETLEWDAVRGGSDDPHVGHLLPQLWTFGEPEWWPKEVSASRTSSYENVGPKSGETNLSPQAAAQAGASVDLSVGPDLPRLQLDVYVPEFAPTDEMVEDLVGLIKALNAYHIACGGSGLVIEDWEIQVPVNEPAEVE